LFEVAELGRSVSQDAYRKAVPALRNELLQAQFAVRDAGDFAVALVIDGVPGAGRSDVVNLLKGWLDVRELETHAWCEAFLPSVGWVGVDPTHGELAGEGHVAAAVGRSYADVPPNRGVYRGDAEEKINVKVTIDKLDERLAAHPPVSPGALDVPSFREGPLGERRMNLNDLAQQQQQQQQQQ
jgi:hypothetical protein